VDPQIAINAKSVEDFVKAHCIVGLDEEPLLNNPPKRAILQVKIQHQWIPTSVVERHRIERVIKLLDLEIPPATRTALFWILIERQTERTRVLLKYLAEYPEPMLKDVETKFISWGYLPGKAHCYELSIVVEGRNRIEERIGMKSRRVELVNTGKSYLACLRFYLRRTNGFIDRKYKNFPAHSTPVPRTRRRFQQLPWTV